MGRRTWRVPVGKQHRGRNRETSGNRLHDGKRERGRRGTRLGDNGSGTRTTRQNTASGTAAPGRRGMGPLLLDSHGSRTSWEFTTMAEPRSTTAVELEERSRGSVGRRWRRGDRDGGGQAGASWLGRARRGSAGAGWGRRSGGEDRRRPRREEAAMAGSRWRTAGVSWSGGEAWWSEVPVAAGEGRAPRRQGRTGGGALAEVSVGGAVAGRGCQSWGVGEGGGGGQEESRPGWRGRRLGRVVAAAGGRRSRGDRVRGDEGEKGEKEEERKKG